MRLHLLVVGVFAALLTTACGGDARPTLPTAATLDRLAIDGPPQRTIGEPGGTVQLRVVASLSDGTRSDVTNEAVWTAVDPHVLTVSRGLVTGLALGGTIVTASYRNKLTQANVSVGSGGPLVQVSGVVLDGVSGTPVVGADIIQGGWEAEAVVMQTDGNGFFNLGDNRGQVFFGVSKFGYEISNTQLLDVREPTRLEIRLRPNPSDYIERTVAGRFEPPPPSTDQSVVTMRITTRAGGVFDALLEMPSCTGRPSLKLSAESGRTIFSSAWGACRAHLTFVVPSADVNVALTGIGATDWVLTYREPR